MPVSVYLHVPFCEVKCGYCDFFSLPRGHGDFDLQEAYARALEREIEARVPETSRQSVLSIFFGGGTPSLMDPRLLEGILNRLARHFQWGPETEITLEANPKTVSLERLRAFRESGFNRISIGVQSFQDRFLKGLGRIHSGDEAKKTVADARKAGFENLNIDLIYALPGQVFEDWSCDLETALDLSPDHLSAYHLAIEEGTPFERLHASGRLPLPSEDESVRMFTWTRERMEDAGMAAYEVSNFACPGRESVHNRNYWHYGEYLGFGTGAVSGLSRGLWVRRTNRRDLRAYLLDPVHCSDEEEIDLKTSIGEYCMLGFRLTEGISPEAFRDRFGRGFDTLFDGPLRWGQSRGWLTKMGPRWRLTTEGALFSNELLQRFL